MPVDCVAFLEASLAKYVPSRRARAQGRFLLDCLPLCRRTPRLIAPRLADALPFAHLRMIFVLFRAHGLGVCTARTTGSSAVSSGLGVQKRALRRSCGGETVNLREVSSPKFPLRSPECLPHPFFSAHTHTHCDPKATDVFATPAKVLAGEESKTPRLHKVFFLWWCCQWCWHCFNLELQLPTGWRGDWGAFLP